MANDSTHNVENANYARVTYYIDKMLSETSRFCRCHRCRMDAVALALNTLPPHYMVSPTHSTSRDLGSPWILVEVAVREAMEKVEAYPHHLPDEHKGSEVIVPGFPPASDEKTIAQ